MRAQRTANGALARAGGSAQARGGPKSSRWACHGSWRGRALWAIKALGAITAAGGRGEPHGAAKGTRWTKGAAALGGNVRASNACARAGHAAGGAHCHGVARAAAARGGEPSGAPVGASAALGARRRGVCARHGIKGTQRTRSLRGTR